MKYHCQSCGQELPDLWQWKTLEPSGKQMVVTCPNCNNEFIRLEYDHNMPYGYRVIPSMIFVPQGTKNRKK